jgi:hypothetical protein
MLSYWKDNLLQHNLDVIHIEKNEIDNILGTILDIKRKTKDDLQVCKDLCKMGLRHTLHIFMTENEKIYMPQLVT